MKSEESSTTKKLVVRPWVVGVVLGGLLLAVLAWVTWTLQPIDSSNKTPQLVRVEAGDGVSSVAQSLRQQGLIRSTFVFRVLALLRGSTIQAGLFHISPADSSTTILSILSAGEVSEKQITLLEGWRMEEMAERLVEAELVTSNEAFRAATSVTDASPEWLLTEYGLKVGDSLEGFLFPDTYRFAVEGSPDTIVSKLLDTFRLRTDDLELSYDDLILASIVEREALFDEDRAAIAGVYANRLRVGMKLDADPTVQYGKAISESAACQPDCAEFAWWPTITARDYETVDSPFNTYRINGLPPTPIANPGLASLQAAAQPTQHDYLYFLHDAEGRTHFARNVEEHTRNKREFLR